MPFRPVILAADPVMPAAALVTPANYGNSTPVILNPGPITSFSAGGVVSGLRSAIAPPMSTPGCNPSDCFITFGVGLCTWVILNQTNTDFLDGQYIRLEAQVEPYAMPVNNNESPIYHASACPTRYVIYINATKFDGCGSVGAILPTSVVWKYDPGLLSTLESVPGASPTPRPLNPDDVLCPPPEIRDQIDPEASYSPVVVPPENNLTQHVFNGNENFEGCPIRPVKDGEWWAVVAGFITGPNDGGGLP
ncbi:hypothetical protein ACLMJK_007026 [Lecanora helva]